MSKGKSSKDDPTEAVFVSRRGRPKGVPPTPHDSLFRAFFADPEQAQALLRDQLPNNIAGKLSNKIPVIHDRSFIDENLRGSQVDLLLEVETESGEPAFVYLLVEHKSYPDARVTFQLGRYMLLIWEYLTGSSVKKMQNLPPIIPLVLYSGQSQWEIPRGLREMIAPDDPELVFMPGEEFIIRLLTEAGLEDLSSDKLLRAGFAVLTKRTLESIELLAEALAGKTLLQEQVIEYVFNTDPDVEVEVLRAGFRKLGAHELEAVVMTVAETLKAEGRVEGRKQDLSRLLERRFGALSEAAKVRIAEADHEQLDVWVDRVLDAKSLAAALDTK